METNYRKAYVLLKNKHVWDIGPSHPMYCCQEWLDGWVNDLRVPVSYNPWRRCYYIMTDKCADWIQIFAYCLHCKKEFPEDLTTPREKILRKEYGFEPEDWALIRNPDNKKMIRLGIQDEFFTEKWWKKRGIK